MGTDKRALVVDGVPLLRRAVLTTSAVSRDVMVVAPATRTPPTSLLEGLDYRLIFDRSAVGGPLAGVEAALAAARGDFVVVVPTDMPWLTPALLQLMIDRISPASDVGVALMNRGALEHFPLVIGRGARPSISRLLEQPPQSMRSLLSTVGLRAIPEADWRRLDAAGDALLNANRPADLAAARGAVGEDGAGDAP